MSAASYLQPTSAIRSSVTVLTAATRGTGQEVSAAIRPQVGNDVSCVADFSGHTFITLALKPVVIIVLASSNTANTSSDISRVLHGGEKKTRRNISPSSSAPTPRGSNTTDKYGESSSSVERRSCVRRPAMGLHRRSGRVSLAHKNKGAGGVASAVLYTSITLSQSHATARTRPTMWSAHAFHATPQNGTNFGLSPKAVWQESGVTSAQ